MVNKKKLLLSWVDKNWPVPWRQEICTAREVVTAERQRKQVKCYLTFAFSLNLQSLCLCQALAFSLCISLSLFLSSSIAIENERFLWSPASSGRSWRRAHNLRVGNKKWQERDSARSINQIAASSKFVQLMRKSNGKCPRALSRFV